MTNERTTTAALDPAVVLDRVGGDTELLREITEIFLSEYPELLQEIRTAVAAADAESLQRSAHTLKGSVSNFGATGATEAALHLELMGRRHDLSEASAALQALELHFAALAPALEQLRHTAG